MTTPTSRSKVPFNLSNVNAFELLNGFWLAAVGVGWSHEAATQTLNEALAGDYAHLLATLAHWCLPENLNRTTK